MAAVELFGTATCPYTRDMREWLELRRVDFVEYDVEADHAALVRLRSLAGATRTVPILVEAGIPTSTAPRAAHATRSSWASPMIARIPRCAPGPWTRPAPRNITTRPVAASTRSR